MNNSQNKKILMEKYILNLCEQYRRGISLFSKDYLIEELDSIAIFSSKQDPLWIIALKCLSFRNFKSFSIWYIK